MVCMKISTCYLMGWCGYNLWTTRVCHFTAGNAMRWEIYRKNSQRGVLAGWLQRNPVLLLHRLSLISVPIGELLVSRWLFQFIHMMLGWCRLNNFHCGQTLIPDLTHKLLWWLLSDILLSWVQFLPLPLWFLTALLFHQPLLFLFLHLVVLLILYLHLIHFHALHRLWLATHRSSPRSTAPSLWPLRRLPPSFNTHLRNLPTATHLPLRRPPEQDIIIILDPTPYPILVRPSVLGRVRAVYPASHAVDHLL